MPVMEMEGLKTSDYYFDLPKELIAQDPLEDRSASRLLVMDRQTGVTSHHIFKEICSFLKPGDCLVLNNTKVIPARLLGAKEDTGAAVEILLLKRMENDVWETLVKPGKKLRPGAKVVFGDGRLRAEILDVEEDGNRLVKFFMMGSGKRCWIPSVKCRCLPILPISFRTKTVIRRYMQNLKALQLRRQQDCILQKSCLPR